MESIQQKKGQAKNPVFDSLNGLRFFIFIPIFFLHATGDKNLWFHPTQYALDYFFILAGFMAAIGHFNNIPCAAKELATYSFNYLKKKVVHFYPLHFVAFLAVFLLYLLHGSIQKDAVEAGWKAALNLLLIQDWWLRSDVKFSYNGVSWFLSCLIFCFAVTPFILMRMNKLVTRYGYRVLYVLALFAVCLKLPLYLFDTNMELSSDITEIFYHNAHSWPPFRLIDFFIGLCAGALWKSTPHFAMNKMKKEVIAHLLMCCGITALIIYDWIPQPIALILISAGIFGVSLSSARIARWLRAPSLVFLGGLVMPVYLTHNVVLKYACAIKIPINYYAIALLLFLLTFIIAYVWQKLKKRFTRN